MLSATALSRLPKLSLDSLLWKQHGGKCVARLFGTVISDRCNLNIVHSPFPPIVSGPYKPLYEFVTQHWKPHGGYLNDQVHIIDGTTGLQRTFHDHYRTIGGLTAALKSDLNIGRNSSVALFCPNHVDFLSTVLATALSGAQVTPINPVYTHGELEKVLQKSNSSVLFAHANLLDTALKAVKNCPKVKHVIAITDQDSEDASLPEGVLDFNTLRHHACSFHETPPFVRHHTDIVPVTIPFSSGTTGMPKGVCLTHENIVTNLLQLELVEGLAFAPGHKLITPLPFYHIYAFTVSLLYTAWKGHTIITTSGRFDFEQFCQLVEEHKPQRTHLVPPILISLAKSPIVDKYDLSSLQTIGSAAAPLSSDIEQMVKSRLQCKVKQLWGMSELSPIGTCTSDFDIKPGSVGPLVSSTAGKILNENGQSLGPNEVGELLIHGPQVMLGYMDDPDSTDECLSDTKWLRTGDVAYYDEHGFFYITDRIKELIKVRGFPVAPAELEALLLTHEVIADVAVIQRPDEDAGELPRAYIVRSQTKEAQEVTEEEIYNWVKERVAPFKRLDGGIEFVDEIPKTASGKILRRVLRDNLKEQLSSKA